MTKYLDYEGLRHFWGKIKKWVSEYVYITYDEDNNNNIVSRTVHVGDKTLTVHKWALESTPPNLDDISEGTTNKHFTATDKSRLSSIQDGAEVNQNAFSTVKIDSTDIVSDQKTDTLTIVAGNNIALTPDASNDKFTIKSVLYGTCSTSGGTASKAVTASGFRLETGACIHIKFTASEPSSLATTTIKLAINSTTAKDVYYHGNVLNAHIPLWGNRVYTFVYDGTYYQLVEDGTKAERDHTHSVDDITDFPTKMTPASHTHGNITNDGKIGTAANKVITTTTGGTLQASSQNTAFNKNFETTTSNIKMNGTASVGSLSTVARADHIHPSDTSKANSNHTHGNINNNGTITSSNVNIGPGDSLIITDNDHQDTGKISKSSLTFASVSGEGNYVDANANKKMLARVGDWVTCVIADEKGQPNGVATLDDGGKIPSTQLPSYVDDVVEVYGDVTKEPMSADSFLVKTGEGGTDYMTIDEENNGIRQKGVIYIMVGVHLRPGEPATYTQAWSKISENSEFRWGGTQYVRIYDGGMTRITDPEIDTATSDTSIPVS